MDTAVCYSANRFAAELRLRPPARAMRGVRRPPRYALLMLPFFWPRCVRLRRSEHTIPQQSPKRLALRRLKTLPGLTPHEAICRAWADEPDRLTYAPTHLTSGLNTEVLLTKWIPNRLIADSRLLFGIAAV